MGITYIEKNGNQHASLSQIVYLAHLLLTELTSSVMGQTDWVVLDGNPDNHRISLHIYINDHSQNRQSNIVGNLL